MDRKTNRFKYGVAAAVAVAIMILLIALLAYFLSRPHTPTATTETATTPSTTVTMTTTTPKPSPKTTNKTPVTSKTTTSKPTTTAATTTTTISPTTKSEGRNLSQVSCFTQSLTKPCDLFSCLAGLQACGNLGYAASLHRAWCTQLASCKSNVPTEDITWYDCTRDCILEFTKRYLIKDMDYVLPTCTTLQNLLQQYDDNSVIRTCFENQCKNPKSYCGLYNDGNSNLGLSCVFNKTLIGTNIIAYNLCGN